MARNGRWKKASPIAATGAMAIMTDMAIATDMTGTAALGGMEDVAAMAAAGT